jgi:tetratricopeptide (TPR) repeat protein
MRKATFAVLGLALVISACAPKIIDDEPLRVMDNGDRVPSNEGPVRAAAHAYEQDQAAAADARSATMADALASCAPAICAAVTRGEVVIGMNRTQVLAATGTTEAAWQIRNSGNATVFVPVRMDDPPSDMVADLAIVQLRDNRVSTYSYREAQGVRVVTDASQATTEGRADALAEMLIREGDDYAARGDLDAALDRYDRASVLRSSDPMLEYRIATVLDKALRPIEALLRYQLFLHRLDIERIQAVGEAYANIAAAQVHARERIIVLERHGQ